MTSDSREEILARALVNAAGPWVGNVISQCIGLNGASRVRLVKGSHIIVKRLTRHDRAYIFQNADGRIVFAIPYEGDFTLIGTTDVDYDRSEEHTSELQSLMLISYAVFCLKKKKQ